jgi:signal transduction histidine kinase
MPADEDRRLRALHSLGLLDTLPEPRFDRITRLACSVAKVPIAVICLVDSHRLWFKSKQGLDALEAPRETSFCTHAILEEETLIVPDTQADSRFAGSPLVAGSPFWRFYAGHPIHAPGGARVGTLCVIDTQPRELSAHELGALADLAALVDTEILAVRFDIATRTVGVGVHERHADDRDMWWSDAMWDIFGQDRQTFRPSADNWLALVHPEDQEYVRANGGAWGKPRTSLSLQYRIIRADGTIRHLQSIASSTEEHNGSYDCMAGITLDVTDRVFAQQREYGLQQKLRESSHQAGMAEIATDVLHSVGNVVNSLGVSYATLRRDLKALRLEQLQQAASLILANRATLAGFLTEDARGRHLPDYLPALSAQFSSQVQAMQSELEATDKLLEHLRDIVSAQQVRAQVGGHREPVDLKELLDITLIAQELELSHVQVLRNYEDVPRVTTDRHKLLLILVNLLNNARDAVLASAVQPGRIVVHLERDEDHAVIIIEDSGVGMSAEVLQRLWRFGYTTKPKGQGFDLHNSANAAREIGATIEAQSDGPDKGSRFTVRLPIVCTRG